MYLYVILGMIYGHLLDDYLFQGILAKLKQKKFWEENAPDELYKNDYIAGLVCHSLEWSLSIHFALFLYIFYNRLHYNTLLSIAMLSSIIANTAIHLIIDNAKANLHKINLIQDQLLHLLQILITSACIGILIYLLF